ncbi:MAG: type II toxin-antitoxin system VapC family toxin [Bacteroidales bacterium]|jgi:predicted nucleic acid-binding protein|nr:type II toxin-antitoxin system VapC family toxin [Bacteroidales bacterium]
MEPKNNLIDTNIAIYYFGLQLTEEATSFIEQLFRNNYHISVINRIELLGFDKVSSEQYNALEAFVNNATILDLDEAVVVETIKIRQQYNTKLPDAIIAASCIVNDCCLLTNNTKDFEKINGLKVKTLGVKV